MIAAQRTDAQNFVRVHLTIEQYSAAGGVERLNSFPVTCVFGLNEWSIESSFLQNAREFYFCDGTNVFRQVQLHNTNAVDSPNPPRLEIVSSPKDPQIMVTPGRNPAGNRGVNLPWLAFCSASYLSSGEVLPLPGDEVRHFVQNFGYKAEISQFKDRLGLPKRIEFRADSETLKKNSHHPLVFRSPDRPEAGNRKAIDQLESDGMVKAIYAVSLVTNFHGLSIPLEFTYTEFSERNPNTRVLERVATGRVSEIAEANPPQPLLRDGERFQISDGRSRHKANFRKRVAALPSRFKPR